MCGQNVRRGAYRAAPALEEDCRKTACAAGTTAPGWSAPVLPGLEVRRGASAAGRWSAAEGDRGRRRAAQETAEPPRPAARAGSGGLRRNRSSLDAVATRGRSWVCDPPMPCLEAPRVELERGRPRAAARHAPAPTFEKRFVSPEADSSASRTARSEKGRSKARSTSAQREGVLKVRIGDLTLSRDAVRPPALSGFGAYELHGRDGWHRTGGGSVTGDPSELHPGNLKDPDHRCRASGSPRRPR